MRKSIPPVSTLGLFSAITFLIGAILIFVLNLSRGDSPKEAFSFSVVSQLVWVVLFFASSRSKNLYFIQPVIYLVLAPINFLDAHDSFYGLGFFVIAVLLLFKIGFFERHRVLKLVGLLVYLYGWELFAALKEGRDRGRSFTPVFFVTVFLVYLYILYREQIIVYLKEPKPTLDLKAKGLSDAECEYIIALDKGKSIKEIATENKIAESTIRNTLARSYKKLGVKDKSELSSLTAKHTLKH
jgi:DNA-binding CsgD family transcriptional regulator